MGRPGQTQTDSRNGDPLDVQIPHHVRYAVPFAADKIFHRNFTVFKNQLRGRASPHPEFRELFADAKSVKIFFNDESRYVLPVRAGLRID